MTSTRHDVTPSPERITESLRDTGYTLNTAVADIVDNSISAHATTIAIELGLDLKGQVRFSVADNGIGIENAAQRLIFDKFYRVPTGDVHDVKGFGLGLTYAKMIIDTSVIIAILRGENDAENFIKTLASTKELKYISHLDWQKL